MLLIAFQLTACAVILVSCPNTVVMESDGMASLTMSSTGPTRSSTATHPDLTIKFLPPPGPSISSSRYHPNSSHISPRFHDAMTIRLGVFCHEQGCSAESELDADDARSWHWISYSSSFPCADHPKPLGCIRLVPPPHGPHPNGVTDPSEKPYIKVGRMAVVAEARGQGLASALCAEALRWASRHAGEIGGGWHGLALVHAQVGVERVWERLGFKTDERLGRWQEEGIAHLGMWREVEMAACA